MSDSKKLGMCNYCQSLGPVFEQEDEGGVPLFLICHNCITDINVGIERAQRRRNNNPRASTDEFRRERKSAEQNWQLMQHWLDNYRNNPKD